MFRHAHARTAAALLSLLSCFPGAHHAAAYDLVREYSGVSFFDRWDFYGMWDNLTLVRLSLVLLMSCAAAECVRVGVQGNVTWVDKPTAFTDQLAYVNAANHVIMRVDSETNVPRGEKRNSVRVLRLAVPRGV